MAELILERWPGQNKVQTGVGEAKEHRERFYSESRTKTQAGVEPGVGRGGDSHPGTL